MDRSGKRLRALLRRQLFRWRSWRRRCRAVPSSPVYVFHHIPRCGGTSLNQVLDTWFVTYKDYRSGWTTDYSEKLDLESLRSCHCLCGHFELEGYRLHQRYPDVFSSDRFRVFAFVREPLQAQLSLWRFEQAHHVNEGRSLEGHLAARPNYLSSIFSVTSENYRDVLGRYCFLGVLEYGQESLDLLARIAGKPSMALPKLNTTASGSDADSLSGEDAARFREENALDYAVYGYCVERLERALAENGR